jgi:hypothetical protein
MCVAVVVKAGAQLPSFSTFHRCWEANSNGAGFVYPAKTDLGQPGMRIVKGLMTFTAFKEAVQRHREHFVDAEGRAAVDLGFHFRIASAGGTSPALTHPFCAGHDVALMHNGHIGKLAYEGAENLGPREAKGVTVFRNESSERVGEEKEIRAAIKSGELTMAEARAYMRLYGRITPGTTLGEIKARLAAPRQPESDTSRLAFILSDLPVGWQRNRTIHYFIKEVFLGSDRVVLMDAQGLAVILNESSGTWIDGCWFSNTYWRPQWEGRHISGKEMLERDKAGTNDPDCPVDPKADEGTTLLRRGSDRALRAQSDANRAKFERAGGASTTSRSKENLWPVPPTSGWQPRLGCTLSTGSTDEGAGARSHPPGYDPNDTPTTYHARLPFQDESGDGEEMAPA